MKLFFVVNFRRLPCEINKDFLFNLFLDEKFASELRIAAYLQVMKCPTYYTVKGVRESLEKEKINQGNITNFLD